MPVRRPAVVRVAVASTLILALGLGSLAACSGSSGSGSTPSATASAALTEAPPSAEDVAALEKVVVEGEPGVAPTITLPSTPFTITTTVARHLLDGDGETIAEGAQVLLHSEWVSGADGSSLGGTYATSSPEMITLAAGSLPQVMLDALIGQKVGVRIVIALPTDSDTQVAVVDVAGIVPAVTDVPQRAEGTPVTPDPALPVVTLADDGAPSITTPTGDAPTELVVQPLITGTGATVEDGQTVIIQYSGWLWDGTAFDSSWTNGAPITNAVNGFVPGFTQGLIGQTVGSQVLLVIPPDLGYGDEDNGSIPGGSTLVFVVDILWAG
jgi:peptidylprolyl isomerase